MLSANQKHEFHNQNSLRKRLSHVVHSFRTLKRSVFVILLLVATLFYYVELHYHTHLPHVGREDIATQTCTDKLHAVGLDFGEGGNLRVSVSQHALARRELYDSMAAAAPREGLRLGGVITQGLTQNDLFLFLPIQDNRPRQKRQAPDDDEEEEGEGGGSINSAHSTRRGLKDTGIDGKREREGDGEEKLDFGSAIKDPNDRLTTRYDLAGRETTGNLTTYLDTALGVDYVISPVLHPLKVPVRAVILPLRDEKAAARIREAVARRLLNLQSMMAGENGRAKLQREREEDEDEEAEELAGDKKAPFLSSTARGSMMAVWPQDWQMLHSTLFHASSHVDPKTATAEVVANEAAAIRRTTQHTCPIRAVLERVIVTPSGVIVGCWQALPSGGEPATLRKALAEALPSAPPPDAQMVRNPDILHTTLARLLLPPLPVNASSVGGTTVSSGGESTRKEAASTAKDTLAEASTTKISAAHRKGARGTEIANTEVESTGHVLLHHGDRGAAKDAIRTSSAGVSNDAMSGGNGTVVQKGARRRVLLEVKDDEEHRIQRIEARGEGAKGEGGKKEDEKHGGDELKNSREIDATDKGDHSGHHGNNNNDHNGHHNVAKDTAHVGKEEEDNVDHDQKTKAPSWSSAVLSAVARLSEDLCGLETEFREAWFVEEEDLLALALRGRFRKHVAPLRCPRQGRNPLS